MASEVSYPCGSETFQSTGDTVHRGCPQDVGDIGAFGLGISQLLFGYVVYKCVKGGEKATDKVWEDPEGLEWTLPSQTPYHTFETPPVVK